LEAAGLILSLPVGRQNLVAASGRGGTSGIGINTYFDGGACFDLGRKADTELLPSDVLEHRHNPPVLLRRAPMPRWPIGVCVPNFKGTSIAGEKAFFEKVCPIETHEVQRILYQALYGVFAAILEKDVATFALALKAIQHTRWKKAERDIYGRRLLDLEARLYSYGASVVALSSLGPGLIFLAPDIREVERRMKQVDSKSVLFVTTAQNRGRSIDYG
jgi:beta-ribofuranosylaminobenzene 5'-phosphate synthase